MTSHQASERLLPALWVVTATLLVTTQARRADAQEASAHAAMTNRVFRERREPFANPERGFYAPQTSGRMGRLDDLRKQGISLLLVEMNLRDFKDRELTPEKLGELRQACAAARTNGLKLVFRAAYGFTNRDYRTDPKDMA